MDCGKYIASKLKWVWITATIQEQILEFFSELHAFSREGGGEGGLLHSKFEKSGYVRGCGHQNSSSAPSSGPSLFSKPIIYLVYQKM